MLFTSTMHLSTKLKKFNKDSMSAGSTDWNIHAMPRTSLHVTSFFSVIYMRRYNSCVMTLWTNFKKS
jgi:hypothetical protein